MIKQPSLVGSVLRVPGTAGIAWLVVSATESGHASLVNIYNGHSHGDRVSRLRERLREGWLEVVQAARN